MSSVSGLMAMRDCTDVLFARLRHSLCIEIGGAMTADTPPQQIKKAAWPLGPCSNSFLPNGEFRPSVGDLLNATSIDTPSAPKQVP